MKSLFILRCLFALLLLFVTYSQGVSQSSDCKEIKAKAVVTDSTPGNDDGKIELQLDKAPARFSVHLFQVGKDPRTNINTLTIESLSKGKYLVVVADKNPKSDFCPKAIEVNVK
jgi:hypothetical protein